MSSFTIRNNLEQGCSRFGTLATKHGQIETPGLLPVVNFIGGTTPNSGGIWRYVRQEIFNADIPIMSQIMHFLDYHLSNAGLTRWRQKTFHEWFPEFQQPLFLDSGGFQLLNNRELNLSAYGLGANAKDILALQLDFGADIIATLDYPLPPNLRKREAHERVKLTIENAITTLRLLAKIGEQETMVFIPVHGRTPKELEEYIHQFVTRYKRARLERPVNGFAIGSLVPLRGNPLLVVSLLSALKKHLRDLGLQDLPLHVFGVSSTLIPFLVYLGYDTFDSSTYVQDAQRLHYSHPETWSSQRLTLLQELNCVCSACKQIDLNEMRNVLTSDVSFQQVGGRFKSEFYALTAMHNLNLHLAELRTSIEAAKAGCLEDHLIEFARNHGRTRSVLDYLASEFPGLKAKASHTIHSVMVKQSTTNQHISLKYKPSDFSIPKSYRIPRRECILFLFPCSKEKPYSTSRTFKRISGAIKAKLNGVMPKIHFVVISGLYGPVPLKYDSRPETTNYDFVLSFKNRDGIVRVGDRLAEYVAKYGNRFEHIVAFAVSKPYRQAIQRGLQGISSAHLFPEENGGRKVSRGLLDQQGLEECVRFLKEHQCFG